jgi:4-diphosphocytidyl-2-C-methyl-D-erythritol kinase
MSGSGATCFALCARNEEAEALARRLAHAQPGWWIKPCRLSAPITNS